MVKLKLTSLFTADLKRNLIAKGENYWDKVPSQKKLNFLKNKHHICKN